jgi:signal transduction histidine kinase
MTLLEATRPRGRGAETSEARARSLAAADHPELAELAASRLRILEAATAERRRIEREIHNGVQQHIVAIRIKLALALEAMEQDPPHGRRLLADLGWELDGAIDELRSLAHGIYPALLTSYGLAEALRSAGRSSRGVLSVEAGSIGRYATETETAVYFCCLQALCELDGQGAGDQRALLRAWEERDRLHFELSVAARPGGAAPWRGRSLLDMRDRIAALGGTLEVGAAEASEMALRGAVPITREQGAPGP